MEKVTSKEISVEDDIEIIINDCLVELDIQDKFKIPPTQWNYILKKINRLIIEPNKRELLKTSSNMYNEYDLEKVYILYLLYRDLCDLYIQEISQYAFLLFTGIEKQTLYNWSNNGSFDLQQIIQADNEASLFNLQRTQGNNPMPYMAKLNRYHGWSGTGESSVYRQKQLVSRSEMSSNIKQIEQPRIAPPSNED